MVEALRTGKDTKLFCAAHALAMAQEEYLGVDAVLLAIIEDKLPITEQIKRKRRRQKSGDCSSYENL